MSLATSCSHRYSLRMLLNYLLFISIKELFVGYMLILVKVSISELFY